MATRLESIQQKIDLDKERAAAKEAIDHGNLTSAQRKVHLEKMQLLMEKKLALEDAEAAAAQPAPVTDAAKLTPGEAAAKAKAIRERPEYFGRRSYQPDAKPFTHADHQRLVAEHSEYMKRASEGEGEGNK